MARLSFWEKLNLILWKNWNIQFTQRKRILVVLLTPIIFSFILLVLRLSIDSENVVETKFKKIDLHQEWRALLKVLNGRIDKLKPLKHSCFVPRIALAYSPNTTDYVVDVMKTAVDEYLDGITTIGFETAEDLISAMMEEHYLAGVRFNVTLPESEDHVIPIKLIYSIIFPSELRIYHDTFIGANWHTYELFDYYNPTKLRNLEDNTGGYVGYIREGFTSIQNAVSMSFLKQFAPEGTFPELKMQRFPQIAHSNDPLVQNMEIDMPFIILIGYLYPCMYIMLQLSRELEGNMILFVKVMGINMEIQVLGWFLTSLALFVGSSVLVVTVLKVHWQEGFAIFTQSSWFAIFFVMVAYNMASICFTYMLFALFPHETSGILMLILSWVLSFMPYGFTLRDTNLYTNLALCICSNSAMGVAFQLIFRFEQFGSGLQISTFFQVPTSETEITVGLVTTMLLGICIPYMLIGLYIHRLKRGFLRLLRMCSRHQEERTSATAANVRIPRRLTRVYEIEPDDDDIIVEIRKLRKSYQGQMILKDISLNLFYGEIVVLMGHNGCGKTALLSIITGLLEPDHGTVIINGFDITRDAEQACENLGVCFQDKVLYPELTVSAQLSFHCRIKGLADEELQDEVHKYMAAMNLQDYSDVVTSDLSVGLRRHLGLCCALCGNSKVVILDEPDTGLDSPTRRLLWELLVREKPERTILITTHNAEVADFLADRIAFMSGGELKCYGTSFFLRNIYGIGSRLVCVKSPNCDTKAITLVLRKYIPGIVPESVLGAEIAYRMDRRYAYAISGILMELEEKLFQLSLTSVTISEPSIEDIFLSMGVDNPSQGERVRFSETMNGMTIFTNEYNSIKFLDKIERHKGFRLLVNQFVSILLKRFIYNIRIKPLFVVQVIMPILITALSFFMARVNTNPAPLPELIFKLNQYANTYTVLSKREQLQTNFTNDIRENYAEYVRRQGNVKNKLELVGNVLFSEHIMERQRREPEKVLFSHVIGATIGNTKVRAWFNNFPLHSAPLSLNAIHNAFLGALLDEYETEIVVGIQLLPYASTYNRDDYHLPSSIGNLLAINLTFCLGIVWSTTIVFLVGEQACYIKSFQFMHGIHFYTFWLGNFIYDLIRVMVVSTIVITTVTLFQHQSYMKLDVTLYFLLMLILFGLCLIPLNFAMSKLFSNSMTALCVVTNICIFSAVTFSAFVDALKKDSKILETLRFIFIVMPHFSHCSALNNIFTNARLIDLCESEVLRTISTVIENCTVSPNCCEIKKLPELTWTLKGILPEVISLVLWGIIVTIFVIFLELRDLKFNTIPKENEEEEREGYELRHSDRSPEHDSAQKERMRVLTLASKDYQERSLVVRGVGKFSPDKVSLHRMHLIIERYECFGLVGSNNAGKSAFMEVLTANEKWSHGRIYVDGISLSDDMYAVFERIGYCRQTDNYIACFTGRETLRFYSSIIGTPSSEIAAISENMAKIFGFMEHIDKQLAHYSPGMKRRLSVAIAFLRHPSIVFLDEPMGGIDLAGRRQICNVIYRVRNTGTSVLIASFGHNDFEHICTRMGVMTNGKLQKVGTPEELLYSQGYLLKIKVKASGYVPFALNSTDTIYVSNPFLKAQSFIEATFPHATMRDQRGTQLYFAIPMKSTKISRIFDVLQRNSFNLNIESFSIKRDTLSIFFLELKETRRYSRAATLA